MFQWYDDKHGLKIKHGVHVGNHMIVEVLKILLKEYQTINKPPILHGMTKDVVQKKNVCADEFKDLPLPFKLRGRVKG